MLNSKNQLLQQLQRDILPLQGIKSLPSDNDVVLHMPSLEASFPNDSFPVGCTHEFILSSPQSMAATSGFVAGVLGKLMSLGGVCIYISTSRTLFPAALQRYGIQPHQVIFIDLKKEADVLYATEEALKCGRITAVISEIDQISFKESRRFQLAAEGRRTTGFLLRRQSRALNTIAAVSRWHITPVASDLPDDLPGVGYARWRVELLKIRNGRPGKWEIEWSANGFTEVSKDMSVVHRKDIETMTG